MTWVKIKAWLTNSWMNSVEYLANMAHVGWAALVLLAVEYLTGASPKALGIATAAGLLTAAAKEYVYDANFEVPKQTFRDNTEDFLGYCLGAAAAWALVWVKLRFLS